MRKFRMGRLYFTTFLTSYMIILLLPVLAGVIIYNNAMNIVETDSKKLSLAVLEQSRDIMDGYLNEMNSLTNQFMSNVNLNYAALNHTVIDAENIYSLRKAWRDLSLSVSETNLITKYYIAFNESDVVLSRDAPYLGTEDFYKKFFHYKSMSFNQFKDTLLFTRHTGRWFPAEPVTLDGRSLSAISYVQTIDADGAGNPRATMIILIDEAQVHSLMDHLPIQDGGWVCITDGDGNTITSLSSGGPVNMPPLESMTYSSGFMENHSGNQDMLVTYARSNLNSWVYVSATPFPVVYKGLNDLRQTIFKYLTAIIILGFFAAAVFAYRNSRPVQEIARMLSLRFSDDGGTKKRPVQRYVELLMQRHDDMQILLNEQRPLVRTNFFNRLFSGGFHGEGEIGVMLKHIDLRITGGRYVAIAAYIHGYNMEINQELFDELQMKRLAVRDIIESKWGTGAFCHDDKNDRIAILLCVPAGSVKEAADRLTREVHLLLKNEYLINISFGVGNCCDKLTEIPRSYEQACSASAYCSVSEEHCAVHYEDIPSESSVYRYSLETEQRLFNLVYIGDEAETVGLLERIYADNDTLTIMMWRQLVYNIYGTLLKIHADMVHTDGELRAAVKSLERVIASESPLDEVLSCLTQSYRKTCGHFTDQKKSHNTKLKDDILAYMTREYNHPQICLSSVATEFGLTEVYLSFFFKEQTGENFSTYLENLRMNHAKRLLFEKTKPIGEIAAQTGYGNDNTFRRAFKRLYGISPTAFRNSGQA